MKTEKNWLKKVSTETKEDYRAFDRHGLRWWLRGLEKGSVRWADKHRYTDLWSLNW